MKFFMMKCEEASKLVSEKMDRELTLSEKMGLKLHLFLCSMCRTVTRQLAFIKRASRHLGGSEEDSVLAQGGCLDDTLTADARARIKNVLSRGNP